jgi:hypothetical protein
MSPARNKNMIARVFHNLCSFFSVNVDAILQRELARTRQERNELNRRLDVIETRMFHIRVNLNAMRFELGLTEVVESSIIPMLPGSEPGQDEGET